MSKNKIGDEMVSGRLLIACYKKHYSDASLKVIQKTIREENPSKIIVLKLIEEPTVSKKVESRVGVKPKKDFLDSVIDEKKVKVNKIAEDVISVAEKTGIPVQVHLRKSELISEKVSSFFDKMDVDHLIIPNTEKGPFEQIIEGSRKERIKDEVGQRKVTILD